MKKKFLALVMTLAMVLSLVPMTALATGGGQEQENTVAAGSQPASEGANGSSQDSGSTTGGDNASGGDGTDTSDTNTNTNNRDEGKDSGSENTGGTTTGDSSTSGTEGSGSTSSGGGTEGGETGNETPSAPETSTDVAKIGDTKYLSISAACKAANPDDTIVLLKDIVVENQADTEIVVTKNFGGELTIDLNGHSIDGNKKFKCLWRTSATNCWPTKLTVKNGTLKNGKASENSAGGAIDWAGGTVIDFVIEDCVFENNSDAAVAVNLCDAKISNCTFTNNKANSDKGAAIRIAQNKTCTITHSTFSGNQADGVNNMGGAVYVDNGTLNIEDCEFKDNSAPTGGAIATSSTVAKIKDTTFSFIMATTTWGGAIYVQYSTNTPSEFTQLTMTDNSAPYGGAISAVFVNVALNGINATKNTASAGGFLANYQSTTTISDCTIESNRAGVGGGLYLFDFEQSQATITGGSLINNNATNYAADIFSGATASLTIPATVSGTLAESNHPIDGWYYDKDGSRWNAHDKDKRYVEQYIPSATEKQEEVAVTQALSEETSEEPVVQPAPLALKAAHGLMYDVVYKVSGDAPEGYTAPAKQTLKANEKYTVAEVPASVSGTKEGVNGTYSFSGWKTADGTTLTGEQELTGDITLYGVWAFTKTPTGGGGGGSHKPTVTIPDDVPTGLNGKDHYAYVVGYPDGMVYPQKNITRAEVATIFFRLLEDETREANMTKSNSYNDMKDGAWYTCAVSTLSKMGIIKGYEDGSFKPDASISRAEFAAIAARFDPDGDKTPATFSDVSSHWAKDEISIAANHGWIKGYEDGSFKPDQKITRAETMTLVNRVLKRLPETKDDLHKDMKTWPDNQNESAWFYLAVQEATNSHYQKLKKDGTHETWERMRETRDWAALEK